MGQVSPKMPLTIWPEGPKEPDTAGHTGAGGQGHPRHLPKCGAGAPHFQGPVQDLDPQEIVPEEDTRDKRKEEPYRAGDAQQDEETPCRKRSCTCSCRRPRTRSQSTSLAGGPRDGSCRRHRMGSPSTSLAERH